VASIGRIAQAFAGIGLHPNRAQSIADMANANPALASRIAAAISAGDDAALRKIAAESQWGVAPAAPDTASPQSPRLEPPGKLGEEDALRRAVSNELGPIGEGPMPQVRDADARLAEAGDAERLVAQPGPQPDFQMDLPPSRSGDTLGDVPDASRAAMSESQDIFPGSPARQPPASNPPAPAFNGPVDNLIARLGGSPSMPAETRPPRTPRGAWQAGESIPGAGSVSDLMDEIDARRAATPRDPPAARGEDPAGRPTDTPAARTPEDPPAPEMPRRDKSPKPRMSTGDKAKLGVAGGVIGAGIGGGLLLTGDGNSPGSASPPKAGPVPNVIRAPAPMSTADLAAQTRPPPVVATPQSPRDQAMKMIDDLNARRRKAGGEVPDAPETMKKINRLLAMSNDQSAAASRGDIPVQGNSPREQAQKLLAQLNAMRRQAGGEVPQATQMMAEVRRLQDIADKQTNARRSG